MRRPYANAAAHVRPAVAFDALRRRAAAPPRSSQRGRGAGVELLALTDHDTVDGVPEALRRARELGHRAHPRRRALGRPRRHEDLHILGYELDDTDADLLATLEDFRGDRARRIEAMADRLRELGFELDDAPLVARREAGKPIGRPHLADAVLAHPANAQRLRDGGDRRQGRAVPALPRARARRPTSRAAARPSPRRSRSSTRPAASPSGRTRSGTSTRPTRRSRTLDEFADAGLDGVECFYATHTEEQTRLLHDARARARAADDRLDRLPRARARPIFRVSRRSRFTV